MPDMLSDLTQAAIAAALKSGADAADSVAIDGTSISIDVRDGKLEHAERSEGVDLGLRVMVGQRQACVAGSDMRPEALAAMAERAVAMAREAPEDATVGLADSAQLAGAVEITALDLTDPSPDPDPATLQDDATRAEAAARTVPGISQIDAANAAFGRRRIHLAASNGFSDGYERTDRSLSCVAITGEGTEMERDYCGESRIHAADLPTPEEVGRIAGERTAARAAARKPPTGSFPVLYDERISASLIGHLLQAVNGTAIVRGASWLRDSLDQPVLPAGLSLIEEPHRPRTSGSRVFDGEGLPTAMRSIVDRGTLTGWTLDLSTARKLGLASTANAARGTTAPPSPANTNVSLTQGTESRDQLMADMGTGLLVTSLIGASINPTTGNYSRGASGFWVENGQITYPVNECTIAGNLRDMLMTLRPANDAQTHRSRVVPSLLVDGMTLAGE